MTDVTASEDIVRKASDYSKFLTIRLVHEEGRLKDVLQLTELTDPNYIIILREIYKIRHELTKRG